MDREAFEQLVSEWLDQPGRDDLRLRIEAALAESPALARVKDQWLRLDRLVRGALPGIEHLDWSRLRHHIAMEIEVSAAAGGLDERLRRLTDVAPRVDWERLRKHVSRAVADADRQRAALRFPLRRMAAGFALLATAAALLLMFTLPAKPPAATTGFAQVRVSGPATALQQPGPARGFACVTVGAPPETNEPDEGARPSRAGSGAPQLAEVFLMVEPVHLAREAPGLLIPLGLN